MKIRKVGIAEQDDCIHEFVPLGITEKKTFGGFYKEKKDEKQGEMYKLFICEKCSRIVSIDFHIGDNKPLEEFKKEYIVKERKR